MANCNGCLKENINGFCSSCESNLFDRSKVSPLLNFNWSDLTKKIEGVPMGFSISGVQRKGFIGKPRGKDLVPSLESDDKSQYIIKPSLSRFDLPDQSPANEHVTMQIAKQVFGIRIAECCYVTFADGTPAYITRRFDYDENEEKLNQEDFTSILKADHKYKDGTYEDLGHTLHPIDKTRILSNLVFNFITGNGDAHLKNFSLLETPDKDMMLSPSYDLMNTKIHVRDGALALNLFTEKEQTNMNPGQFYDYSKIDFIELGTRWGIKDRIIDSIIGNYEGSEQSIFNMLDRSFLINEAIKRYKENVNENFQKLFR